MGSALSFRLNTSYVVVGGLPAPYVAGIDQPEGMVPLWFDCGWFRQAVVTSSSSWGVVVTALTSTRRGHCCPRRKGGGGCCGPPYSSLWWRTSAVAVVDWMRSPVWQCFSTEKHCHSVRQRQFAVALLVHKICGVGRLNFTLDGVATHYVKYQNS